MEESSSSFDSIPKSKISSSSFEFVKGFITGQVALLSILLLILRLLFFRSAGPSSRSTSTNSIKILSASLPVRKKPKEKTVNGKSVPKLSHDKDAELLERLFGLDHQVLKQQAIRHGSTEILVSDETSKWLTFLIAKLVVDPTRTLLEQDSSSFKLADFLQDRLSERLQCNKASSDVIGKYLEKIQIKTVGTGTRYPAIESYQLVYNSESESCAFRVRSSWQDSFDMEIESAIRIANIISLPFSLTAKLRNLRFTLQIQVSTDGKCLEMSCLPDDHFLLDIEVGSLIGHRTKLKDLPKITSIVVDSIKKALTDRIIFPKVIMVPYFQLDDILFHWDKITNRTIPNHKENEEVSEIVLNESFEPIIFKNFDNFNNVDNVDTDYNISYSILKDDTRSTMAATSTSLLSDESEPAGLLFDSRYEIDDFEREEEK